MSRLGLTLSFTPGKHHQVVSHGRRIIGECELQLELVEETEARERGICQEGGVTELVGSAEPGTGHTDGCKTITGTFMSHSYPDGRLCETILLGSGEKQV